MFIGIQLQTLLVGRFEKCLRDVLACTSLSRESFEIEREYVVNSLCAMADEWCIVDSLFAMEE